MPDYNSNTVPQLKEILKERGLPVDGKKADLVSRLTESDASATVAATTEEPAAAAPVDSEPAAAAEQAVAEPSETATEPVAEEQKPEEAPVEEKPKTLTPEERKSLAVDLLTKKIKRAEKFGDEAAAETARKDLARIEKFGVEPGTALAKEIGLVDRSFNNGLGAGSFKNKRFHKKGGFKKNSNRRR